MPKLLLPFLLLMSAYTQAEQCPRQGVYLQVLGSGGPEISDGRASSAYLLWQDGKAKVLVDFGGGALLRFEQSGAKIEELEAVAFTHFHLDHSADFAPLIKASFFTNRSSDLPIFGPQENHLLPSADSFVEKLFAGSSDDKGVWPYLSGYIDGGESYRIVPTTVTNTQGKVQEVWQSKNGQIKLSAISVNHGPLLALAWRIDVKEKQKDQSVVISGDMSDNSGNLIKLLQGADTFVAHHAIPEGAKGVARRLHMPPSRIAMNAQQAQVKSVVLSHHMSRSLADLENSKRVISKLFDGSLAVADDLDCYAVQ